MNEINLILTREDGETWLECITRLAKPHELEEDVIASYKVYVTQGMTEEHAAFHACYDWDVLPTSVK